MDATAGIGNPIKKRLTGLAIFTVCLCAAFWKPLSDLVAYAANHDLYSHVLFVPLISAYFLWSERENITRPTYTSARIATALAICGALIIAGYFIGTRFGWVPGTSDYLFAIMLGFVVLFWSGCFAFLGVGFVSSIAFPFAFLIFLVPFPTVVENGLESLSQNLSAEVFNIFLHLSQTSFTRDGTVFLFQDLEIEVAPQCSGLRSSFVLSITGLLLGQLCLRRKWSRIVLVIATIPIGLLRNGMRIFALTMLTLHFDPNIIHGPLHKSGGPPFFVASLVPLLFLTIVLRRREKTSR